jgi:hypothetical protein
MKSLYSFVFNIHLQADVVKDKVNAVQKETE